MENLFSYGTLQMEQVQQDTFGRQLTGKADVLKGYEIAKLKITDKKVIASSGTDIHPILKLSANPNDIVYGICFELMPDELLQSDRYEVSDYQRTKVVLQSGRSAWIYCSP